MGKAIAFAVAAGAASAVLVLAIGGMAMSGGVVLTLLVPLPLLLAGLSLALPGAAIATAAACLAIFLATGNAAGVATLALGYGLPVMLISRQALLNRPGATGAVEWYPPGRVLLWIVGYGIAGLIVATGATLGIEGGLQGALTERLGTEPEAGMPPQLAEALGEVGIEQVALILPGMMLALWSLQMMVNIWLAQGVLLRFGRAYRPSFDIAEIEMPNWVLTALAVASLVAAFAPGVAGLLAFGIAFGLGFCFFMAGLGVIHASVRAKPFKPLALAAVYVSLVLVSFTALLIAGLGVVDQWAGFRRRALARNRED